MQYGVLCKIRFIEVVYKLILHASKKSYCMKLTNEDVLQVEVANYGSYMGVSHTKVVTQCTRS